MPEYIHHDIIVASLEVRLKLSQLSSSVNMHMNRDARSMTHLSPLMDGEIVSGNSVIRRDRPEIAPVILADGRSLFM